MNDGAGGHRTEPHSSGWDGLWCRHPGTLARRTPRSIVVSTDKVPAPVAISGVAMCVWLCVDGTRTTDEIVAQVAKAIRVPAAVAEAKTLTALCELVEIGALVGP